MKIQFYVIPEQLKILSTKGRTILYPLCRFQTDKGESQKATKAIVLDFTQGEIPEMIKCREQLRFIDCDMFVGSGNVEYYLSMFLPCAVYNSSTFR